MNRRLEAYKQMKTFQIEEETRCGQSSLQKTSGVSTQVAVDESTKVSVEHDIDHVSKNEMALVNFPREAMRQSLRPGSL